MLMFSRRDNCARWRTGFGLNAMCVIHGRPALKYIMLWWLFLSQRHWTLELGWNLQGLQAFSTFASHTIHTYQDKQESLRSVFWAPWQIEDGIADTLPCWVLPANLAPLVTLSPRAPIVCCERGISPRKRGKAAVFVPGHLVWTLISTMNFFGAVCMCGVSPPGYECKMKSLWCGLLPFFLLHVVLRLLDLDR